MRLKENEEDLDKKCMEQIQEIFKDSDISSWKQADILADFAVNLFLSFHLDGNDEIWKDFLNDVKDRLIHAKVLMENSHDNTL